MTDIKAVDAAKSLRAIATKLYDAGVLQPEGRSTLYRVVAELKLGRRSREWQLFVDRSSPVTFSIGVTSDGKKVRPSIDYADIKINQDHVDRPPFDCFDIAVLIENENGGPSSRWHLDQANVEDGVTQSGPLFHLQFGGRNHSQLREQDHPIKEPRWNHPPMDLALMCETILANFFEKEWLELRDDPSWCKHICLFQNLCYDNYLATLRTCLDSPKGSTMLKDTWGANWL